MKIAKSHAVKEFPKDVSFEIQAPEEITRGEDVIVVMKLKSLTDQKSSVDISLTSQIVRYTGVSMKKLKVRNQKVQLAGKQGKLIFVHECLSDNILLEKSCVLLQRFEI